MQIIAIVTGNFLLYALNFFFTAASCVDVFVVRELQCHILDASAAFLWLSASRALHTALVLSCGEAGGIAGLGVPEMLRNLPPLRTGTGSGTAVSYLRTVLYRRQLALVSSELQVAAQLQEWAALAQCHQGVVAYCISGRSTI